MRAEQSRFGELVKIVTCHSQTGEECLGINFQHEIQNSTGPHKASEGKRARREGLVGGGRSEINWMFVSQSRLSPLRSGIICK